MTTLTTAIPLQSAAGVVADDLALLSEVLREEFARMGGSSLLVTGGAGFLGHYLVQGADHFNSSAAGRAKPIRITVFDNLGRGAPTWLARLRDQRRVNVVVHDMRHPLPSPMIRADWIIHAASIASPTYYRLDPIGTMDANINGLRNLLEHALSEPRAGRPIRGFLFFSSSEIYGDADAANIPTVEEYRGLVSCTGPRACYDEAKRYGEALCANFVRQHGLPVKVARPFNNYGPGLKITDGRLIPDFARDILAGRDIRMLSDGSPTRTFCYSADAIQGYFKALVNGGAGEAYNIGTETPEISVAGLASKMIELSSRLFGYRGRLVRAANGDADYLVDNPSRRCPVIDKARREIGYDPRVSLDEGLRRSLLWYAGNREGDER